MTVHTSIQKISITIFFVLLIAGCGGGGDSAAVTPGAPSEPAAAMGGEGGGNGEGGGDGGGEGPGGEGSGTVIEPGSQPDLSLTL